MSKNSEKAVSTRRSALRPIDYLMEIAGLAALLCLIIMPFIFLKELPDALPKHFKLNGEADSYGGPGIIWSLPITGVILYIGMTLLIRFPHLINYPVKVTAEVADRMYQIGTGTVRVLKLLVVLSFTYINYQTIRIGLDEASGLGRFYLPVFLALIATIIGIMIFKMIKLKPSTP